MNEINISPELSKQLHERARIEGKSFQRLVVDQYFEPSKLLVFLLENTADSMFGVDLAFRKNKVSL